MVLPNTIAEHLRAAKPGKAVAGGFKYLNEPVTREEIAEERARQNKLRAEELGDLRTITPGLYRAIESFREVSSQDNKIDQVI